MNCEELLDQKQKRLPLASLPTPVLPVERLLPTLLGPDAPRLLVKRDDLSGCELSGNKVRKLEYLLAEALALGADTIITCGGVHSNHARATALAAARLGLRALLLLRTEDPGHPPALAGNLLLCRLAGAEVRFISREDYARRGPLMAEIAAEVAAAGRRPYIIPEGGSNALGALGYVRCVAELARQLPRQELTLCHALGSGGTGAGLCLGVALLGLPWRVVGINVCDDRAYFVRAIGDILDEAGRRFSLEAAAALSRRREDLEIIDGYVGRGYARSRPEELVLIRDVCRAEGVVLDPVYTGKAMYGLVSELRRDPRAFGDTIVFIHTGGIFGIFHKADEIAGVLG